MCFLPYVWVDEWGWTTIPLVAFTAFALFGIEGASSEVEIPFDRSRSNHLALDAYCMIVLDSVMGQVVHEANMDMQRGQRGSVKKVAFQNYEESFIFEQEESLQI